MHFDFVNATTDKSSTVSFKDLELEAGNTNAKGFGTNQVRERLATLYGDRAGIEFGDVDGGGCRVTLRYPLQ